MPIDKDRLIQYQIKTEAPPGAFLVISQFESSWHQPWSEPVRFRVAPRRRVAEMVSGLFAPVLEPNTQIISGFESQWHQPWSEPVRAKRRLRPGSQQAHSTFFDTTPSPSNLIQGWFQPLSLPVRPRKKGLRRELQQTVAMPVRYLPPANVTARLAATETNNDVALVGVNVYNSTSTASGAGANVSISEVPAIDSGAASVQEE